MYPKEKSKARWMIYESLIQNKLKTKPPSDKKLSVVQISVSINFEANLFFIVCSH